MKPLKLLSVFLILVASITLQAQTVNLDEYNLEIKEVLQKNAIGTFSPDKGNKFVGIDLLITALSQENKTFNLENLVLKSEDGSTETNFKKGVSSGPIVKIRKPKLRRYFAQVSKSFKKGNLYYNNKKIGSIAIADEDSEGSFDVAK